MTNGRQEVLLLLGFLCQQHRLSQILFILLRLINIDQDTIYILLVLLGIEHHHKTQLPPTVKILLVNVCIDFIAMRSRHLYGLHDQRNLTRIFGMNMRYDVPQVSLRTDSMAIGTMQCHLAHLSTSLHTLNQDLRCSALP